MLPELEKKLNSFNYEERKNAFGELLKLVKNGKIDFEEESQTVNMHCHTFFSYNGYGYSPIYIAWWGKKTGRFAMGIVDFDVLDGVDEFIYASNSLGLRCSTGTETRVFIPELKNDEINSPGEPGISYHMGVGFKSSVLPETQRKFLNTLKEKATSRTKGIVERVNKFLSPLELDFDKEVLPLTPAGNPTERHVCTAYRKKSIMMFPDKQHLTEFWADKFACEEKEIAALLEDNVAFEAKLRAKTMKSGGVGYVKPEPTSFPEVREFNKFVSECGAVPVATWLNGLSSGEQNPDKLLDLHLDLGAKAVNIIPDRNWNVKDPKERDRKIKALHKFIEAAKKRKLPIIVGTEMNAPGQKLIDDFSAEPLRPYVHDFIQGALFAVEKTKT